MSTWQVTLRDGSTRIVSAPYRRIDKDGVYFYDNSAGAGPAFLVFNSRVWASVERLP